MALDIRRLYPEEPEPARPRRVLHEALPPDPLGEEFLFADKGGIARVSTEKAARVSRPPRRIDRRLVVLVILVGAVAAVLVARNLGSQSEPEPTAAPTQAPAPAPSAAPQPVGVPMLVVNSNITTNPAARTYRATVSIRNPTDVAAADVSVEVVVKDASGNALRTESRHLDVLASGGTAALDFSGEFDPQRVPQTVDAKATAASSSA